MRRGYYGRTKWRRSRFCSEVHRVPAVAAEVTGRAHGGREGREPEPGIELLGSGHRLQRLEVTAPVSERLRCLEAGTKGPLALAMAARLGEEVHLPQLAHARLPADERAHAAAADQPPITFQHEVDVSGPLVRLGHRVDFGIVDRESGAARAELGHDGADELGDGRIVLPTNLPKRQSVHDRPMLPLGREPGRPLSPNQYSGPGHTGAPVTDCDSKVAACSIIV